MSDDTQQKKPEEELGVSFGEMSEQNVPQKPGPEVFETANKHLAPTKVPGKPEEDVFNVTRAFNEDAVEMGTIVSDKRHQRVPIGQTLKSAFGEWWGKTRKQFGGGLKIIEEKLEKKEPDIEPRSTDRSDIISEATKQTVQPPKEDHHVIIEKTKTLPKDAERVAGVPYQIKKEKSETPEWATKKEGGETSLPKQTSPTHKKVKIEAPDMRGVTVAPVVEKRIKTDVHSFEFSNKKQGDEINVEVEKPQHVQKTHVPEPPKPKLPPIEPQSPQQKLSPPVFVSPKVTGHSFYATHSEVSSPEPQSPGYGEEQTVSQRIETDVASPLSTPVRAEVSEPTSELTELKPASSKKALEERIEAVRAQEEEEEKKDWGGVVRIGIIVVIAIVAVVLGVIAAKSFNIFESTDAVPQPTQNIESTQPLVVPSFFFVDIQEPIYLEGSKKDFLASLKERVDTAQPGVTQFYPVRETGTGTSLVSTWDVFSFLQTRLPLNVIRTLDTTLMFGAVVIDRHEPFIVLRSRNFDTLFTGLLNWEDSLYQDLEPLFESSELVSQNFVDAVKHNASVRILYNELGEEVLLYALINRNTVIITSSTKALAEIIEQF